MDSTDKKAYDKASEEIWSNLVFEMTIGDVMLETWKAAKEYYEKEYSIPKAEGKL